MRRVMMCVAAVLALGTAAGACTLPPPSTPTKPTIQFGLGGGACLAGATGAITVQSTPIGQSGNTLPTGNVSLSIDNAVVQIVALAPDVVDGTSAVATFSSFTCPTAGQHSYSFTYNGDTVYKASTQGPYDLLAIPAAPNMAADLDGGIINVGGVGCDQNAIVNIYGGAPGNPTPPLVATAEADVTANFFWYTKVQLTPGTYELQANCPLAGGTLTYNPVTITVP